MFFSDIQATIRLCKYSDDKDELIAYSNPIDIIIFPEGHKEKAGKCIGFELAESTNPCKFKSLTHEVLEGVVGMETGSTTKTCNNIQKSSPNCFTTKSPNTSKPPIRLFEFGKDKIASPNKKYGNKRILDRRENPGIITADKLENGLN